MQEKIEALLTEIEQLKATTAEEVESIRIKYLSKKGIISSLMDEFRNIPADQKREVGMKINALKQAAGDRLQQLKEMFAQNGTADVREDLSRTSYPVALGTRHPLSIVREEICDIFKRLGFTIAEGPEVEDDWHVFSSLNFADDHPARDMQDTFFIQHDPQVVLR
ncbi:MAG TPA: phenylalanine--tRNA ligase subunit alpha, partial [Proteiniphilum sp.]|nr:phenylalanine--tRNA ligase subunit alpha [Proteiniphilum sp.]